MADAPFQPMDPHIDQVKLTAYALGELAEPDAAEVELWISGDEAARRYVELVREEAAVLRRAFHARSATLTEEQHEALAGAIGDRQREPSIAAALGIAAGLAAAACIALLVILPRIGGGDGETETLAVNDVRDEFPDFADAPSFDLNEALSNTNSGRATSRGTSIFGDTMEPQDSETLSAQTSLKPSFFGIAGQAGQVRPAQPAAPRYDSTVALANIPTTTFTITEGDTLAAIARDKLGDEAKWPLIAKLNKDAIPDPNQLQPGQEILLPDLERWREPSDRERYDQITDNPFLAALDNPLSTFSIDVDTASYANVRRFLLKQNQLPPADAVRIEELVNYFSYDYSDAMQPAEVLDPQGNPVEDLDPPFGASVEIAPAPWNEAHRLVRIGLKGDEPDTGQRPAANLVFLLDVSGSMNNPDKLPLLQEAFKRLTNELADTDRVAIVVYAGAAGLVLDSTPANNRQKVLDAINNLRAGGSTAGGAGIQLAYQVALENYIADGVNRVILATDGDFNVGTSSDGELVDLVKSKANPPEDSDHAGKGVYLSVLGFGSGNVNDQMMEKISNAGNGNYFYIDSVREAQKVLVEQMGGTLVTIAKDVKIQVEFNPAEVASYRLIGYENRILAKEDFADDTVDAGDIGAGHTVTALYEVVPVDHAAKRAELRAKIQEHREAIENIEALKQMARVTAERLAKLNAQITEHRDAMRTLRRELATIPAPGEVDELKYQAQPVLTEAAEAGELMTLKLRYKAPDAEAKQGTSTLLAFPIRDAGAALDDASGDFKFAAAVAGFGMLLRDSPYKGEAKWELVTGLAMMGQGDDPRGYRAQFIEMTRKAEALSANESE
ncbi:MAG: DUF3520 domain-containing protein [Planctomycetes bacterium]|jgi:Ca-activated chloride channel family protein|nr:DUF3520 domain-containing protein [Planctomycetota bacterium]